MKRISLLIIFWLFIISFAMAQSQKGYKITVTVKDYPDTAFLLLGRYYGDNQYITDTAFPDKKKPGQYIFKGDTAKNGGIYILLTYDLKFAEMIIDKEQQFNVTTSYPNIAANISFKNSSENIAYEKLIKTMSIHYKTLDSLQHLYKTFHSGNDSAKHLLTSIKNEYNTIETQKKDFISAYPDHIMSSVFKAQKNIAVPAPPDSLSPELQQHWSYNYYKTHYFDSINLCDDRLLFTPVLMQRFNYYISSVLSPDPDSLKYGIEYVIEKSRCSKDIFKYLVWYNVDKYQRSEIIGYDAIWVYLAQKYYLSGQAYWASKTIIDNFKSRTERVEKLLIGNIPPEFYCPDTNADTPDENFVSVFSSPAKYTVVIFWEPDCGHCQKQMPKLKDLYLAKKDSLQFEVIAVCKDFDVNKWKNYIHEKQYTSWINLNGKSSNIRYDDSWDIYSTPTIYILDQHKRIVAKRIDVDQIEQFINFWNNKYH